MAIVKWVLHETIGALSDRVCGWIGAIKIIVKTLLIVAAKFM